MSGLSRRHQPEPQRLTSFIAQSFDQREPSIDPALVATAHRGDFGLLQSVFTHEREDDPSFFQFHWTTDDAVEIEERRFGRLLIDFERFGV